MRSIRSNGTKPETLMRLALVRYKLQGWQMNNSELPGKPDFIFSQQKLAIFVDGCFWHGCKHCYRRPKSNKSYWDAKLLSNRKHDIKSKKKLLSRGWRILRLWEHEVREEMDECIQQIKKSL